MPRETYVYRDGKLIPKHLAPPLQAPRGAGLQVIRDIEPFRNIAVDGAIIGGRKQRRDMMRAHGLIEVGTERLKQNKTEFPENRRDVVNDLKQAYRQHGVDVL